MLRYLNGGNFNFENTADKIQKMNQYFIDLPKTISNEAFEVLNKGVVYTYKRDLAYSPVLYMNM